MQISDTTYMQMDYISEQIEGVTCALNTYLENAGFDLEKYEYKPFNDFANAIRQLQIDAVKKIKDMFAEDGGVSDTVCDMLHQIRESEESIAHMEAKMSDMQDTFSRLVLHSENIRIVTSKTGEVYVPDAQDELYRMYSGYERIVEQYFVPVDCDEDDFILQLFVDFYEKAMSFFLDMNKEYDKCFHELGLLSTERQNQIKSGAASVKKTRSLDDNKTAGLPFRKKAGGILDAGLSVAETATAIAKKDKSGAVEKAVGLVAGLAELLEDKLEGGPVRSAAKGALNVISNLNDAMEAADNSLKAAGYEASSAVKLIAAAEIMTGKFENMKSLTKSKQFENAAHAAGLINDVAGLVKFTVSPVKTPLEAMKALKHAVSAANHSIELTKHLAKKFILDAPPKTSDTVVGKLQQISNEVKAYQSELEKYKNNIARGAPCKKPEAKIGIKAVNICGKVANYAANGIDIAADASEKLERAAGLVSSSEIKYRK